MSTKSFQVEGMTCQHCVNAVTGEVLLVPGVTDVAVDLAANSVTVTADVIDEDAIAAAVDEAGYVMIG